MSAEDLPPLSICIVLKTISFRLFPTQGRANYLWVIAFHCRDPFDVVFDSFRSLILVAFLKVPVRPKTSTCMWNMTEDYPLDLRVHVKLISFQDVRRSLIALLALKLGFPRRLKKHFLQDLSPTLKLLFEINPSKTNCVMKIQSCLPKVFLFQMLLNGWVGKALLKQENWIFSESLTSPRDAYKWKNFEIDEIYFMSVNKC